MTDKVVEGRLQSDTPAAAPMKVVVTDLHMPFGSMVTFMVKWSLAAIPAIIILAFLFVFIYGAILSTFMHR